MGCQALSGIAKDLTKTGGASLYRDPLMIGALFTHAVHAEYPRLIPPLVLGGLASLLYSSRPRRGPNQTPHGGSGV
jgi:hypothetical protein